MSYHAHCTFGFRGHFFLRKWFMLSLSLVASSLFALDFVSDLTGTTGNPPSGWTYAKLGSAYSDGALKFDKSDSSITTCLYPAAVTNLSFVMKGNSVSGSRLDLFGSTDGVSFTPDSVLTVATIAGSKDSYTYTPPAGSDYRSFRFVYKKVSGNLAFYSVTASYSDAAAPATPVSLSPTDVGADSFIAQWEPVDGATNFNVSLERILSAAQDFTEGFDLFPNALPLNWSVSATEASTSDVGSGFAPPALKLSAAGEILSSPLYDQPISLCSFWLKCGSADVFDVSVSVFTNGVWGVVGTASASTSQKTVSFSFDPAWNVRQIRLSAVKKNPASESSLLIDDVRLVLESLSEPVTVVSAGLSSSCFFSSLPSGLYRYAVAAENAYGSSDFSSWQTVQLAKTPPLLSVASSADLRLGETLTLPFSVVSTDGDPVISTSVTAVASLEGIYSLSNGLFRFTPATMDVGTCSFLFCAEDIDGVSSNLLSVTVRAIPLPAFPVSSLPEARYQQDFNSLSLANLNEWDNGAGPLSGWYAFSKKAPVLSYKGSPAVGLWSYLRTDADIALGVQGGNDQNFFIGFSVTNDSPSTLSAWSVAFTAAQVYVGNMNPEALAFEYRISDAPSALTNGLWRRVPALCFTAPVSLPPDTSKFETNCTASLSAKLLVPVLPGEVITFRWCDQDDPGTDHRYIIDDLSLSWSTQPAAVDAVTLSDASSAESFDAIHPDSLLLPIGWRTAAGTNIVPSWADASPLAASCLTTFSADPLDQSPSPTFLVERSVVDLMGRFQNQFTPVPSGWTISYAIEKWADGNAAQGVKLFYSSDGATWTPLGHEQWIQPAATQTIFNVTQDYTLPTTNPFYLAWRFTTQRNSTNTTEYIALALDNITLTPRYPTSTLLLLR